MRAGALNLCVTGLLLLTGCGRAGGGAASATGPEPAAFDGDRALYEVHGLVRLGARDAGTPGAERAAQYLLGRLRSLGLQAELEVFTNRTPVGERVFRNVLARVPGAQSGLILVASHYDTKSGIAPDFQGANDSGSSSGVLLELGRIFAGDPPWRGPSLQLTFFDGEEAVRHYSAIDGLHGSRHHAARIVREGRVRDVRAMILLDMIGDRDLSVTVPRNVTTSLATLLLRAAEEEGLRGKFALYPYEVGDDHEPFLRAGIPALDIIDFHYGSAPGRNDYWHTRQDTMDKISAESLGGIGRIAVRMLNALADKPSAKTDQ